MLKFQDGVLPHLFWMCLVNVCIPLRKNSDFQLQYKLNETEHHPKFVIC